MRFRLLLKVPNRWAGTVVHVALKRKQMWFSNLEYGFIVVKCVFFVFLTIGVEQITELS